MEKRSLLRLGLLIWSLLFVGSFIGGQGVGGVSGFLALQVIAGMVAVGLWIMAGSFEKTSAQRRYGRIPAAIFLAMCLAGVLFFLTTGMVRPAFSDAPTRPEIPKSWAI